MKQFFLFVLLALASPALAQRLASGSSGPAGATTNAVQPPKAYSCAEPVSHFQHLADSLLGYLDKTQIRTGILYDRVSGMASLDVFGHYYNDADTSGVNHFLQAYYELHVADYYNSGTEPCRQLLRDNARYHAERGEALVGALRYRFNYIDTNAVRNNQLMWSNGPNSQLQDVSGRGTSPYIDAEVVVGAALLDTLRQGAVTFRFDPASTFTNTGLALTKIEADFDDGTGTYVRAPGETVDIGYGTVGRKVLRYTFTYADGQRFTTYSTIYVTTAVCTICKAQGTSSISPCLEIKGFTASTRFQGYAGVADISYFYRTTNNTACDGSAVNVVKPVVIIDGFDHEDTRNGAAIFNDYLAYRDINNNRRNLGSELQTAGYDVVILNSPNVYTLTQVQLGTFTYTYYSIVRHGGSDYMERNGLVLVSLLQELNRQMQAAGSTEQIAVIGPSMGGQISRYALSYMEANNIPHNTRLWISLDSPHNGANIPIGLQHFIKYFADETGDEQLVKGLEALDSPASRELAQHYYDRGTYFLPDYSRTNFVNAVTSFRPGGFPANLRRVAVTNGALNGARQVDQNGQVVNDEDQAFFLEQQGIPTTGVIGLAAHIGDFFPSLATRLITTASARVWYAPGSGRTSRVLRTYILGTGSHSQEAEGVPNSCGLDGAPGGYRTFFNEVADGNNSSGLFQERNFYSVRDKAVFIPMLSALAYTGTPVDNCANISQRNLVCEGTTPFDAYYGPMGINEEHIHLTPGNVAFMRSEILGTLAPPVFAAAPASICPGATATYSVVTDCPRSGQPGTTYTWTLGTGLQFANGSAGTGPTQTIRAVSGYTGTTTIRVVATRAGFSASTQLVKNVRVVSSALSVSVGITSYGCWYDYHFSANTTNTQATFAWRVDGVLDSETGPFFGIDFDQNDPTYTHTVSVQVMGICPASPLSYSHTYTVSFPNCTHQRPNNTGPTNLASYPNPANDYLVVTDSMLDGITVNKTSGPAVEAASTTAALYNAQGLLVRQTQLSTDSRRLNTSDMPAGLYHLTLQNGQQVKRTQIRVAHD